MDLAKKTETAKQIAVLLATNGATYLEVPEILEKAKNYLHVEIIAKPRVVFRDGAQYERKPYAKDYTPVRSLDTEAVKVD